MGADTGRLARIEPAARLIAICAGTATIAVAAATIASAIVA